MKNMLDKFITRLRDFTFGRPRIKVIEDKAITDFDVHPIFIVGTFRSGTTLVRFMLDSHSRICCPPESKYLESLASIYNTESRMRALERMGYDEDFIRSRLRRLSDEFFIGYMLSHDKKRWADKTPEYVRVLEFIEWLYGPHCKYILIYRNGLDTANSMNETYIQRLENGKDIRKAFEYWMHDTETIAGWSRTYPERCYTVKYEDLCTRTEPILRELFDFLGEDWEDDVLKWYKWGHDRGPEDIKARRQRRINISSGNYRKWPQELQEELKKRATPLHEMIGYDPDTLMPYKC